MRWLAAESALALGVASGLAALPAAAENWTVTPAIAVRETYTTNANLAPSGREEWSFITDLTPSIGFNGVGARARLSGDVAVQLQQYLGERDEGNIYPRVNLLGSVEAIERFFFVEGAISISQRYLSPFAPQPQGNIGDTNNRYDSYAYRVSPYIKGTFAGEGSYLLRNDSIWSSLGNTPSNVPGLSSSFVNRWTGSAESPARRTFSLGAELYSTYTKFTNQEALTSDLVQGLLHWRPDPQVHLYAIGGYEQNNYTVTESSDITYGGGGEWRPTERTEVAGRYEHRFFGDSYLASVTHRNPFSAINLNASRNISTYPQQLFGLPAGGDVAALVDAAFTTRIPDPVERAQAVQTFLNQSGLPAVLQSPLNYYTQQILLIQQANATFTLLGVRNSLAFTVYNRKTEPIAGASGLVLPPEFAVQNNNTQTGGSIAFNHRLTPLTSLTATATRYYTEAIAPLTARSTTNYFLVSVGTQLSPKTTGVTGLTYTVFDSNLTNDYDAFTAYVGLNHRF
ncbi:MAG: TIGR03016 family PEP-CTERM system-associated outer membrane protein [Burkholderiales bacterium]